MQNMVNNAKIKITRSLKRGWDHELGSRNGSQKTEPAGRVTRRTRQGASGTRSTGRVVLDKCLGKGLKARSILLVGQDVREDGVLKG